MANGDVVRERLQGGLIAEGFGFGFGEWRFLLRVEDFIYQVTPY